MKKKIKILIALIVGFALAMLLMSVAIYFGYTNAYSTDVNTLTVKILGIPIYELTKSGTEYIGKSIGVYMGAVCGICMALSVIAEELMTIAKALPNVIPDLTVFCTIVVLFSSIILLLSNLGFICVLLC